MLIEGLLAVVALCAVGILTQQDYAEALKSKADAIPMFAKGVGTFMAGFGMPVELGAKLTALAVSAFALTSLDTGTRLARFAFQEFFQGSQNPAAAFLGRNRYVATAVPVALGSWLAFSGQIGTILPVFGGANQLLAALAFLAVAVWLAKLGRGNRFLVIPMVFMFVVTLAALGLTVYGNLTAEKPNYALALIATLLFVLAVVLASLSFKKLKPVPDATNEAAPAPAGGG